MVVGQSLTLDVFTTESPQWLQAVREHVSSGRNFLLVLPPNPEAVREFCSSFGLKSDCLPRKMSRADFLRMSQHVPEGAFDQVLRAFSERQQVFFLEQIDFGYTRPPNVQPHIVYSPIFGILSQHSTGLEARKALAAYTNNSNPARQTTEAVVYHWDGKKWAMDE